MLRDLENGEVYAIISSTYDSGLLETKLIAIGTNKEAILKEFDDFYYNHIDYDLQYHQKDEISFYEKDPNYEWIFIGNIIIKKLNDYGK